MKRLRRERKKQNLIIAMRTCITPKCTNTTQSFYCDECWSGHPAAAKSA